MHPHPRVLYIWRTFTLFSSILLITTNVNANPLSLLSHSLCLFLFLFLVGAAVKNEGFDINGGFRSDKLN